MVRLATETKVHLTLAEETLLDFLLINKGSEYTPQEIEAETGIPASKVNDIMNNLRWKGFEVCSEPRRDVHYYANNTWRSYAIGAFIVVVMMTVLFFGWSDYLESCPGCPPEGYEIHNKGD